MGLREEIFSRATTHSGLSALISTRCYPLLLPKNCQFPAIRYTMVSQPSNLYLDHDGNQTRTVSRVQIDAYAGDPDAVNALADQVFSAFNGWSTGDSEIGWCWVINRVETHELELDKYRVTIDLRVDHKV